MRWWDMFICGKCQIFCVSLSLEIRFEFQPTHIGVVFSPSVSMPAINIISFFHASASFSSITSENYFNRILKSCCKQMLKFYCRYVDDTLVLVKEDEIGKRFSANSKKFTVYCRQNLTRICTFPLYKNYEQW